MLATLINGHPSLTLQEPCGPRLRGPCQSCDWLHGCRDMLLWWPLAQCRTAFVSKQHRARFSPQKSFCSILTVTACAFPASRHLPGKPHPLPICTAAPYPPLPLSRSVLTLPWSPTREPTRRPSTASSSTRGGSPWQAWPQRWPGSAFARRCSSTRNRRATYTSGRLPRIRTKKARPARSKRTLPLLPHIFFSHDADLFFVSRPGPGMLSARRMRLHFPSSLTKMRFL